MAGYLRVLIGVVAGLGVGLLVTVIVIAAKVGFLVDTPRAAHPFVLAALFAVPALAGGLMGYLWRRPTRGGRAGTVAGLGCGFSREPKLRGSLSQRSGRCVAAQVGAVLPMTKSCLAATLTAPRGFACARS